MNVALTRARRLLIVVGDSRCVSVRPFFKDLVGFLRENGQVRDVKTFYKNQKGIRMNYGKKEEEVKVELAKAKSLITEEDQKRYDEIKSLIEQFLEKYQNKEVVGVNPCLKFEIQSDEEVEFIQCLVL
jgi:hypothetical protein